MLEKNLAIIYKIAINDGMSRVLWLENYFNCGGVGCVEDDLMNMPGIYREMVSHENIQELEGLYLSLLREMNGRPYSECGEFLKAFVFLQMVLATALWKYHLKIGEKLESFTRDFDRLDDSFELFRLYDSAQVLR